MSVYVDNAVGATSITGLDGYLISGTVDQYGPMIGVLVHGASYAYRVVYASSASGANYETGVGVWDSATNTLSRSIVKTSSNANAPENWGPGEKVVYIVNDSEQLTDMEQMINGPTKFYLTSAQSSNIAASKTKTDLITVTVPANLDAMQSSIAAFSAGMTYRGSWDASTGVFPGSGVGSNGDYWFCSVSGVVDTVSFDAGDSIVALVNNPSISTFAGNWSRHDSLDAVQSVAGLIGTVTTAQLRGAMNIVDPFSDKPVGEPIVIVFTGQSNCTGAFPESDPSIMPVNANVFDWRATTAPQTGPFAFFTADPMRDSEYFNGALWTNAAPFTGMIGQGEGVFSGMPMGNMGWTAANLLQQTTGRDVYLITVHWSGQPISHWLPGQACQLELSAQVNAALSAVPSGPVTPDLVIWMQGESDYSRTPQAYEADWSTVKTNADGDWSDANHTRWLVCGFCSDFYSTIPANPREYWGGLDLVIQRNAQFVQYVNSAGTGAAGDFSHYSGPGYTQMGQRIYKQLSTQIPAQFNANRDAANIAWEKSGGAVSDVPDGATAIGFKFATGTYANAESKHTSWFNGATEIGYVTLDGGVFASGFASTTDSFFTNLFGSTSIGLPIIYGPDVTTIQKSVANTTNEKAFIYRPNGTFNASGTVHTSWETNGGTMRMQLTSDGILTTSGGLGQTTITAPTVTHVSTPPSTLTIAGTETLDYTNPTIGERVKIAGTFVFNYPSAGETGVSMSVADTFRNEAGVSRNFNLPVGLQTGNTYLADGAAVAAVSWSDIVSNPQLTATGGGSSSVTFMNHITATGVIGASTDIVYRTSFYAQNPASVVGTLTNQTGLMSFISGATNNTHILLGGIIPAAGNWAIYQSDTLPTRLNGGVITPWAAQSGASAVVAVKGTRTYVFANGSTSTITLPSLAEMTTGYTAAQLRGYELVVINNRTTDVATGAALLLGAGTSFGFGGTLTITARQSRIFTWNGVDTWL